MPYLLSVVADSAGKLLPADRLLTAHHSLKEADVSLEVLHGHQHGGVHRVLLGKLRYTL